ncbi:MAG TPA: protoporphyrinogen oxidase [Candidatus Acidoferrales bacterium]|nr:protoporphyrinogen oxidase [Candidatus Acidoferrales bacterium]
MVRPNHAIVIGAGISGLACAYRLKQLGIGVTLLEGQERAGGLIGTVKKDGFLFESGPQSFQGTDPLLNLIRELGIEGELQQADPRASRYILRGGRLQRVPMSPQGLLASSLLNPKSRWKIASEPFRRTAPPSKEESVADFVRRKFGHEILEYLVAPFVSGVYAGDPEKLSLRAAFPTLEEWERQYGSVVRGAMKSRPAKGERKGPPPLYSFRNGLATLMQALRQNLGEALHEGAAVNGISRTAASDNEYEVRFTRSSVAETIPASGVVIATPAYTASHLVMAMSSSMSQALSGIAYAPVAVVAAGYHVQQIGLPLDGFGFLVPRNEKIRTLGTVWNSSLFPGRAPEGFLTITSFIGGATDLEIIEKSESEVATIVGRDNARILGIEGLPVAQAVWKYPKALPQYNLGHGHLIEAARDAERALPGLFLAGNYLDGPAIGKCVEQGFRTAESVGAYLKASS